jgi:cell wall-associated NlpC family hydrolase
LKRFLAAALCALSLAAAAGGTADAKKQRATVIAAPGETLEAIAAREHVSVDELSRINGVEGNATALRAGTVLALDASALNDVPPPAFYVVSTEAHQQLKQIEIASNMPHAGADLEMWSGGATPVVRSSAKSNAIARFARGIISRTSTIARGLTRDAMRFIGTPYVFGGTSPSGFDCSGYVQHVFAMMGIHLPRTADAQFYAGHRIANGMQAGDLVFFQTYEPGPSHVGIYLGRGRFVHSSSHGVMVSRIADAYWASRYLGAKRVMPQARLATALTL